MKEISLVQRTFIAEYPKDGTASHSVIKNILSNFEKYDSVAYVSPKNKNQDIEKKSARKLGIGVSSIVNQKSGVCRWCFSHTCVPYFSRRHAS